MSQIDSNPGRANPFRGSTSVQLEGFDDTTTVGNDSPRARIHIPGGPWPDLRENLTEYFESADSGRTRGRVMALVGGYGLGKSHIAEKLIGTVRERGSSQPIWVIGQPFTDMGSVYRNRIMHPRDDFNARAELERAVTDYHSDVVADLLDRDESLLQSEQERDYVRGLRERRIDPQKIAQTYDLDQELIQRRLREHLKGVTDHRAFATALALLLRRPFNSDVWDWLSGERPAQSLRDRGITGAIDGIQMTFDALAVFSFVYGQVGKPYVLVLDDFEKVYSWRRKERMLFINAFEMLVNCYVNEGGLLVFCIQPDSWGKLPPSLHERVSPFWLNNWNARRTEELISAYVSGPAPRADAPAPDAPFAPFTRPAVGEVAVISDGVPRRALRVCESAWNTALGARGEPATIDRRVVHRAVRADYETRSTEEVYSLLDKALTEEQWGRAAGPEGLNDSVVAGHGHAPYWVRVAASSWIAIVPVGSVLGDDDVEAIRRVTDTVRDVFRSSHCEVLIVVNGQVSRTMRDRVTAVTDTVPLAVGERRFARDLTLGVAKLADRLRTSSRDAQLERVRDRLDTITAQQSDIMRRLDSVEVGISRHQHASAVRADRAPELPLPDAVQPYFTAVFAGVDRLLDGTGEPSPDLGVDGSGMAAPGGRPHRMDFSNRRMELLGTAAHARNLIKAFQRSLADWWRTVGGDEGGPIDREQHQSLFVICRSFEISIEVLPPLSTAGSPGDSLGGSFRTGSWEEPPTPYDSDPGELLYALGGEVLRSMRAVVRNRLPRSP